MKKLRIYGAFTLGLSGIFLALPAFSQNQRPYLTGATIYISVDDWADIWLNDIQIVESQPITPDSKGFQTIQCIPQHLCYFQNENILAIENQDAYKVPRLADDRVGLAYILRLRLSNGTQLTFSSNDLAEHRSAYIPDRTEAEPRGWRKLTFDDSGWPEAQSTGTSIPNLALLTDPETNLVIQFLSATGISSKSQYPGERHLYRRKIFLDIGPNPYCAPQTAATVVPVQADFEMERVEPLLTPRVSPMLASAPLPTPTPWVLLQWRPSPLPTQVPPSWPTATPTLVPSNPAVQPPKTRWKRLNLSRCPPLNLRPGWLPIRWWSMPLRFNKSR